MENKFKIEKYLWQIVYSHTIVIYDTIKAGEANHG